MAGRLLVAFGAKEGGARPESLRLNRLIQGGKGIQRAGNKTGFEQIGGYGDVLLALFDTLLNAAHCMADL